MNRFVDVGFHVAACSALPTVPAVTGTWYQRTAAWVEELPCTVWLSHRDSMPPMFVYWFCAISRMASVSRLLPFFEGTVPGGEAHEPPFARKPNMFADMYRPSGHTPNFG